MHDMQLVIAGQSQPGKSTATLHNSPDDYIDEPGDPLCTQQSCSHDTLMHVAVQTHGGSLPS